VNLEGEIEPCEVEAFTQRKSDLQESVTSLQKEIDELKALRKATKRHIPYKELPPEAQFDRLSTQSKHFIDTIKMIAYRAETAMAQILRQNMTRHDDARSLLRAIYSTEVDIVPDPQANTLTIRSTPRSPTHLQTLPSDTIGADLNTTETLFPGTELRLIYDLVSSKIYEIRRSVFRDLPWSSPWQRAQPAPDLKFSNMTGPITRAVYEDIRSLLT